MRPNTPPVPAGSGQRDTVVVDPAKRPVPSRRPRTLFASAIATTLWCATVVYTPILVLVILAWWLAGREGDVSTVVAAAGAAWLAGHGAAVDVAGLHLTVTPLLLTAVLAWRLSKAAAGTTRAIGGRDAAAVRAAAGTVSIFYIGLTAGVAALVSTGPFSVSVPRTLVYTVPFAVVATAFGAARGAGVLPWDGASVWLRRALRTGSLVVGALLAFGAAAVGVAFAVRGPAVADTFALYGPGAWAVALLSLLYLPNLAVWAVAYICGPGFAVGTDTAVQAELVELNPLPAFPLFAAVPVEPLPASATILIGLPLMLASVFGVLLTYRSPDLRVPRVTTAAILAAGVAAALLAGLSWFSRGAAGRGLLAEIGPDPWSVAALGGLQILVGLVGAALVARLFAVHRRAAESELVRRDTVVIPEPAPCRDDALVC
ncbi:cell division protein PerM [Glycomyces tarimensis]